MVYDLAINQVGLYFKVIVNLESHWPIFKAVQGFRNENIVNPKKHVIYDVKISEFFCHPDFT